MSSNSKSEAGVQIDSQKLRFNLLQGSKPTIEIIFNMKGETVKGFETDAGQIVLWLASLFSILI